MAYTTINKSTAHFNTKLFTGTGSSNAITGVGFQPDWVWIKDRQDSHNHNLFDAVRGVTKRIHSDTTDAETTNAESLKSFDSDGFTLGTQTNVNQSGHTNVAWNWKAGTGQGSSNTDGSLNTTYTSVNTTAGFSISKYTGTGSSTNYGHGLGVVPKIIFTKNLTSGSAAWRVSTTVVDESYDFFHLNTNGAKSDDSVTAPTSSLIYLDNSTQTNTSGQDFISYAFAEKTGYSKIGFYSGNGNTDGTFVYTGFKPAFVLHKRIDSTSEWFMFDNKRLGYNPENYRLMANHESTEADPGEYDLLSNGFKIRVTSGNVNGSVGTYIYMAFGQSLVGSNNVPCTAR